jgi:cell division protein FtsL
MNDLSLVLDKIYTMIDKYKSTQLPVTYLALLTTVAVLTLLFAIFGVANHAKHYNVYQKLDSSTSEYDSRRINVANDYSMFWSRYTRCTSYR